MHIPEDIRVAWGEIRKVATSEIVHDDARLMLNGLDVHEQSIDTHVYLCSDYRNEIVRDILGQISGVAVFNNAGNVVYNPHKVASVVIAHGSTGPSGCGAVGYVRDLRQGEHAEYQAFAEFIEADPIVNATKQLAIIPEEEQAGILYFDHSAGRIADHPTKEYARAGNRLKILEEIKRSLEGWYSNGNIPSFVNGQDPEIIFLNNIRGTTPGFKAFHIDLQADRMDPIIRDSLRYALAHSLHGEGSFEHTQTTVIAFQDDRQVPDGFEELLNGSERGLWIDYINRGGQVFLASVGHNPSQKRLYSLNLH
jgi:hypothetical protein